MAGISVGLLSSSENLEDLCLERTKRKKNSNHCSINFGWLARVRVIHCHVGFIKLLSAS